MINQGDIYLADLNPVKGHEQAGFRPVLVLQNNVLNKNLSTAVVVPITSHLKAKGKLTTYFLSKSECGFEKDSVVLLFQIRTIDKRRLIKKLGRLDVTIMYNIRGQLQFVF